MFRYLAPLLGFIVLAVFLAIGLGLNPKQIPSPLIGKPAPAFALPNLDDTAQTVRRDDWLGQVWILNVWASWCVSCREEHAFLLALSTQTSAKLIGLNYKDQDADAKQWLQRLGNPYALSVADHEGRTGIDYGVYGVPETFVIDKHGVIRYKHTGPVGPGDSERLLLPLISQLQAEP